MRGADQRPEQHARAKRERATEEHPCRDDDRGRAEDHVQRLGIEHGGAPDDDRQEGEEAECGEPDERPLREEQARKREQEQSGREHEDDVEEQR